MSNNKCVICLSPLDVHAIEFPLVCPAAQCSSASSTSNNICTNCSLVLQQQQQQSGEARCPNCKADISGTIYDTNLLRFAAKNEAVKGQQQGDEKKPDSELSGAELRFKYSTATTTTTQQEIQEAKLRLSNSACDNNSHRTERGPEEMTPRRLNPPISNTEKPRRSRLEQNIFHGLESFLSQEEQLYIRDLMASGIPSKLAQAAQILYEIRHLNHVDHHSHHNLHGTEQNDSEQSLGNSIRSLLSPKTSQAELRAIQMSMPKPLFETNPLPLPKHVVLKADFDVYARYSKLIKFKDDGWDGSLSDAFSRMYSAQSSEQQDDAHQDDDWNGKKNRNRVIVTEARRQAGKMGIQKGDVVTHVNMEEFVGDAQALREMIDHFYKMGNGNAVFSMTLNADQNTADELKQRLTGMIS